MNQEQTSPIRDNLAIAGLLRRHGIGPTAQRIEIASILLSRFQHLSADQVMKAVNRERPTASKATVYNTLNLFAERGLVRQVIIDPSKIFYDSNIHPHYHFYNEDTGELIDLKAESLQINGVPELPPRTVECGVDVIVRVKNEAR